MVIGAFPVVKLGALLMKQLSKPIANFAKERAKKNYFFRTYICMPPAQFYNWCEVKTKMWIMNLGKPTTIPNLNEAMAIELGANLLGETIVFSIAAGILYIEYSRQVTKELVKEKARQGEISTLNYTIQQLYFQVERQDVQIKELLQTVSRLEKTHTFLPKWDKNKPQPPPPAQPPPELILPPTPLVSDPSAVVAAARKANVQAPKPNQQTPSSNPDGNGSRTEGPDSEDPSKTHSFLYGALASLQGRVIPFSNLEEERGILRQAVGYLQHDVYRGRGH